MKLIQYNGYLNSTVDTDGLVLFLQGLAPKQAVIWTNDNSIFRSIFMPLA